MKRIIILAVALTAGLSSCDLLDTKPMSQMTQTDYFKTETDLQLFTNPLYNNMLDKDPYDDQSDLMVCQTLSDEILGGNKRTVPNSGGGWTWTDLRRINTLLEYADQCDDKDAVTHYTALARFFRAYFYFEKVKRFGDVPWYDVQLGSADEALYNPRDSRELIMTKMIEDIDFAINELPKEVSTYRVNRWAALALKAQFCLYEGTYRKYHDVQIDGANDYTYYLDLAAKAAGEVINQGPYKLYSTGNPDSDYMMLFAQENASPDEYILAIKFDYGLAIHHNATAFTLVPTQGRPGYTRKMVNMYLMKDGSRFTDRTGWQEESFVEETKDRDPRLAQSIRTPGYTRIGKTEVLAPDFGCSVTGYQPIKFVQNPDDSGGNVDRNDRSTCDIPVYRLAEVMLIYAEAKAELGTLTQDDLEISINKIRDRVDMPPLNLASANADPDWYLGDPSKSDFAFSNVSGANQGVILEIRRERAIEMIQEGTRYEDLVRWKAGPCLDQALTGMYFPGAGQYDLTGDGKTDLILYNEGSAKPEAGDGVYVYQIGTEILLSGGTRGYVSYHKNIERTPYNEERDYLYPIPINERSLNPDLTQNPGWNDGLSF